jgi:hypothetical protein
MYKNHGTIAILFTCTIALIISSGSACALPAAPLPPTSFDSGGGSGGGGGGGGSGGGSNTPTVFEPYSIGINSSDNMTTGIINVKGYFLSTVMTNSSLRSGNDTWDVGFMADLSAVPSSAKMEVRSVSTGNLSLPIDTDLFSPILAFRLTRSSSGGEWQMKDGTVYLSLKISLDMLNGMDTESEFYLVKDDGTRFIVYRVMPVIQNSMALFNVPLWYESRSPAMSGIFTLAGTREQAASGTTVTPTPGPVDVTPSPKATGSNASVFLLAAALGITAIFIGSRKR